MHDMETHDRFVELRARGWSLDRIAAELHVAKRTLVTWHRQHQQEITTFRSLELEALQDRILASHEQELVRLSSHLNQVESVLAKRKLECLSTEFLFCLAGSLRSQLHRLRAGRAPGVLPPPPPAGGSPVFEAPVIEPVPVIES